MNIKNNDKTPSFRSGLTYKLIKDIKNINIKKTESDFAKAGVDAKFFNNKFVCTGSALTADILAQISGKYKLPFEYLPPAIRTYKDEDLLANNVKECIGFSNVDTKRVLKGEHSFIANSLFFNNNYMKSAIRVNIRSTIDKLLGMQSSSHFLHTILHEWFHCIHQNLIYEKFGYEGKCPVMKEKFYRRNANGLDKLENKDYITKLLLVQDLRKNVEKNISEYAASEALYSEIFAELMTKITTKSLNRKLNVVENPLDNIPKGLAREVKEYIEKTLNI